ncbi:hypothetical protein AB9Q98_05300 [Neisseria gonorrhoeae]
MKKSKNDNANRQFNQEKSFIFLIFFESGEIFLKAEKLLIDFKRIKSGVPFLKDGNC